RSPVRLRVADVDIDYAFERLTHENLASASDLDRRNSSSSSHSQTLMGRHHPNQMIRCAWTGGSSLPVGRGSISPSPPLGEPCWSAAAYVSSMGSQPDGTVKQRRDEAVSAQEFDDLV